MVLVPRSSIGIICIVIVCLDVVVIVSIVVIDLSGLFLFFVVVCL